MQVKRSPITSQDKDNTSLVTGTVIGVIKGIIEVLQKEQQSLPC